MLERTAHLLVLDADSTAIELLTQALHSIEADILLHHVPDAITALNFLSKKGQFASAPRPDVLLLDLDLPMVSGVEAVRVFQDMPLSKDIPIIVLTAQTDPSLTAQCHAYGATAVWVKPPRWDEYLALVTIIRECLEGHDTPKECLEEHASDLE